MKILITGIGGFVGPYLEALLQKNGHEVFGFERTPKENTKNIFYGNILNIETLGNALRGSLPDAIVHLAGYSSVKKSFDEPELCHQINVQGTKNLIESCLKLKKTPRLLVITSAEIYGEPQFIPITEEHPLNPTSPYGKSRLAQEEVIRNYKNDLEIIIARSFNHTGPAQQPIFVVPDFAKQLIEIEKGNHEPKIFIGNSEAVRDFTDVRDVVEAYFEALTKAKPGEIYNICSGKGYKIREILDQLVQFSGIKVDIEQDSRRLRPSDIPVLIGSYDKFTKATGWSPQIPFEKTLDDMLNWWRSNL